MTYGQCENAAPVRAERLLPMGLASGCRLRRAVAKDAVLGYDDVELPPGRVSDRLRAEQEAHFSPAWPLRALRRRVDPHHSRTMKRHAARQRLVSSACSSVSGCAARAAAALAA